jgi:hypothetical protein
MNSRQPGQLGHYSNGLRKEKGGEANSSNRNTITYLPVYRGKVDRICGGSVMITINDITGKTQLNKAS